MHAHEQRLERARPGRQRTGRKRTGRKPAALAAHAFENDKINATDPDSRPLRRAGTNLIEGYIAQALAAEGQLILAPTSRSPR